MKKQILGIFIAAGLLLAVVSPAYVLASPATDACDGITAAGGTCATSGADDGFKKIVTTIVTVLSVIVGAVSVIMIILGGFRYVISGGDSNGVSGAKNTIMYAIIGLLVVIFAQVIVSFVYSSATKEPASSSESSEEAEAQPETSEEAPAEGDVVPVEATE